MILECPNCETQYEIPVELPPEGRKVRCASCQHIWMATAVADKPVETVEEVEAAPPETEHAPEPAQDTPAGPGDAEPKPPAPDLSALDAFEDEEIVFKEAEETPAGAAEPEPADTDLLSDSEMEDAFSAAVAESGLAGNGPDAEEEPESPPIVIGKAKRKTRGAMSSRLAAGWAALAVMLTGVLALGYFQRVNVVRLLPGAAAAYERIGLPVNVRGLAFEDVKYSWDTSAGRPVLEVAGSIANITGEPLKVPTVVFGLRTKEMVEVYQWAADVRADMLPPGESAGFTAQIPSPPKSIRDVQVRFAKVR